MQAIASQILIHATQVTRNHLGDKYEFILNIHLAVVGCVKLNIGHQKDFRTVQHSKLALKGTLFELKHVRVNPTLDNSLILAKLTYAFSEIGVRTSHQPQSNSMAICYKPMGEIRDNVRFYLNEEGKMVFLSPITRPRLVYSKPRTKI